MIDHGISFSDSVNELLRNNLNVIKLYGSFNGFYQNIVNAHNLGVDFGVGNLIKPKEIMHLQIYEYLLLSEGIFSKLIDMLCYFLIQKGNSFEYQIKGKTIIVEDLYQLQRTYLIKKLTFLKDNGFNLFIKFFNIDLRNAIAHIDFDIDEKGNLIYNKVKLTDKEMHDINSKFLELIICMHESLKRSYEDYLKELSEYKKIM